MPTYDEITPSARDTAEELLRISVEFLTNMFKETADAPYRLKHPQKSAFGAPKAVTDGDMFKACLSTVIPYLMGAVYYRNKSYLEQQETFQLFDGMSGGKFYTSNSYANAAGTRITAEEQMLHHDILNLTVNAGGQLPFINVRPQKPVVGSATFFQIKEMALANQESFMGKAKLQPWMGDFVTYLTCIAHAMNVLMEWGQAKHQCRDYERLRTLVDPKREQQYKSQLFLQMLQALTKKKVIFGEYPSLTPAATKQSKGAIALYNSDRDSVTAAAAEFVRALDPYFHEEKPRSNNRGKAELEEFKAAVVGPRLSNAAAARAFDKLVGEEEAALRNRSSSNGLAAAGGGGGILSPAAAEALAAKVEGQAAAAAMKANVGLTALAKAANRVAGNQGGGRRLTRKQRRRRHRKSRNHQ